MRGEVRALEEKWGDRLRELGQTEAAINHFIDAGCSVKAAEAAMECHNWKKALEIVEQNQGDDRSSSIIAASRGTTSTREISIAPSGVSSARANRATRWTCTVERTSGRRRTESPRGT